MAEFLVLMDQIDFWHWWILAALLMALEVFAPTTLFLWTGVSAAAVGAILYFADGTSWQVQFVLFALLSVASVFAWRVYARLNATPGDESMLNRRGAQYVGRVFILEEAIVNGAGQLQVDDTNWKIAGEDCPGGARVRVIELDGAVLKVEKA
jgi:membrane protein implicated in regulation of membrane protease activity